MKKISILTLIGMSVFLASSCALLGPRDLPPEPPPDVTTETLKRENIPVTFEFVGFTQSSHQVEVRARVEGYLDKVAYTEGDMVQKGKLLFQIDPRPFEATLAQAKGTLAKQKALLWDAEQTVARIKPLYEQNAASKRDYDNALSQFYASQAEVEAAEASVLSAKINLEFTTIRSAIKGLSGLANFREGALISPGPNSLLTTLSAVDPMWVLFSVSENDLLKYTKEKKNKILITPPDDEFVVELVLADGSTFKEKGAVNFAAPYFDQKTGTLTLRATFPNPQASLKPGEFVRVLVTGAVRPNAIAVPQQAVQQGKTGMYVFLVDKDNKAIEQPIVAGSWDGKKWIINKGLEEGDRIIVDGVNKVRQGSTVNVIEKT